MLLRCILNSMHWIQTYILEQLLYERFRRHRDLRPPRVESNLFQYHLLQLQKMRYVIKCDSGYTLGSKGLEWADKYSGDLKSVRSQSKIVTMTAVINEHSEILLMKRARQPFLGTYQLPAGKLHRGETLEAAAVREVWEKAQLRTSNVEEKGWVHIVVYDAEYLVSDYLAFVYYTKAPKGYCAGEGLMWVALDSNFTTEDYTPGLRGVVELLQNNMSHNELKVDVNHIYC